MDPLTEKYGCTESVRKNLPDDETIYDLASLFKMFGDPTRAKILSCLQIRDLYVGELAEILGMSDSAISHQLRVLRAPERPPARKQPHGFEEVGFSLGVLAADNVQPFMGRKLQGFKIAEPARGQ